jgi:hypothetical protein
MKLLGIEWFNNVGIARCEGNLQGDVRYYIKAVAGHDEQADTNDVMQFGSKFPKDAGDALFGVAE